MTKWMRGARLGLAALGAGMLLAGGPALSQTSGTWPPESAGDALSRNLRTLAQNPRSLQALMGAGQAALSLGGVQAALTFFAQAEEVSPRDGRIKRWMGSALVQLEQPQVALKFFKDATDLGVPEGELAGDRGLAYDISGDPRRAQRDYRLALQQRREPEVTRRLALSLAITGEREAALRLLEDQLLSGDRAAERTRALVLALTGDMAEASRVVQASMPGPQASAMTPFLARLPSLSYAERAMAVHLGHFPGSGRTQPAPTYALNNPATPAPALSTSSRPPSSPASPSPAGSGGSRLDSARELLARRVASAEPAKSPASRQPPARTASQPPAEPASRPATAAPSLSPGASWTLAPSVERPAPAMSTPAEPAGETQAQPGTSTPVAVAQAQPAVPAPARSAPTGAGEEMQGPAPTRRLADLAATVASIPDIAPPVRARTGPEAPAKPAAKPATGQRGPRAAADEPAVSGKGSRTAAAASPKKAKSAPPAEPSRVWVQVAGGADKAALPREFARLKGKAPELLGSRAAWTAKLNATNRLLVGPFADAEAAQDFVNALGKRDLRAFAWTSGTGEKIEKLPAK